MKDTFERFLCSLKWFFSGMFVAFFILAFIASGIMSIVLLTKFLMGTPCEWYLIASPGVFCVLFGIHEAWDVW